MSKLFARFLKNESGATAIEYGLIAALIAVAIIVGATAVGTNLNTKFNDIATKVSSAGGSAAAPAAPEAPETPETPEDPE
jgi:pilus assembly protein Flp/PilA